MNNAKTLDRWQLAEIHGAWHSLLLKMDVLAASNDELTPAQELLSNGLEVLEDTLAGLREPTHTEPETPEDSAAIAAMMAQYFLDFLEDGTSRPGHMTEQPEAQPLIAALQEICPQAQPGGWLVKMFLAFAGGVDAGLAIAQSIAGVDGEGAQA